MFDCKQEKRTKIAKVIIRLHFFIEMRGFQIGNNLVHKFLIVFVGAFEYKFDLTTESNVVLHFSIKRRKILICRVTISEIIVLLLLYKCCIVRSKQLLLLLWIIE